MLVSLQWLRDFVTLPDDVNVEGLAERLTRTTAEVDGVHPVRVSARGLVAARVRAVEQLPNAQALHLVTLEVADGRVVETVSAAPRLHVGLGAVYAPPGASVAAFGTIREARVAGRASVGMILPGESLGIEMAAQEAIFLAEDVAPGAPLDPILFDDWVIEFDNKSLTNRPDLWGHYGLAREVAAILGIPLEPYPAVPAVELGAVSGERVPIVIADADACPRYSALVLRGTPARPSPLWMQLRLGRVGMRPIVALVDLTNYVCAELGQPMHAFDAGLVSRIEVDWAREGEMFRTLDGVERTLTDRTLMIQSAGHSVAIAGVMGGLESEVAEGTTTLLLESANFAPVAIRRAALALGLRTDASARFEKGLDPANTVLGIQRFVRIAREVYPEMSIASPLSDAYPRPSAPRFIPLNMRRVSRMLGREVAAEEVARQLEPLGFRVAVDLGGLTVEVPTFRATGDVTIEEDVIEELARRIGYDTIVPEMPQVSIRRFEPNGAHELEKDSLRYLTSAERFIEVHGYIWYNRAWMATLGVDPGHCVTLVNPAAEGLEFLRRSLMPGLLSATVRNRFYFPEFSIVEIGSVFEPGDEGDAEFRHVGLLRAARGKDAEQRLYDELKGGIERWVYEVLHLPVTFQSPKGTHADRLWEHPYRTADVIVGDRCIGQVGVVDVGLRVRMDEHLGAWAVCWAEFRLNELLELEGRTERLGGIPSFPLVEMDFSIVVPTGERYPCVVERLTSFRHPLLRRLGFVAAYEGESVGPGRRSLTFRAVLGSEERTLNEEDGRELRARFEAHVTSHGYEMRSSSVLRNVR
jgi:phenylalanyl-tRNA synthetase beta chain